MTITIDDNLAQQLSFYEELLKKDLNTMLHEAFEQYFISEEKRLSEQDPLTNLSYDEFWDGVEL